MLLKRKIFLIFIFSFFWATPAFFPTEALAASTPKISKQTTVASKKVVKKKTSPPQPNPARIKSYLILRGDGKKFAGKNSLKPLPIASLTKMMTALVFLDYQQKDWSEAITYYPEKHFVYGNYLRLSPGDTLTVRDLLYSLLVASVNEPARMLVEATDLSEKDFIAKMNARARALGMKNTRYVDVSGFSPQNISTATDQAKLLKTVFAKEELREIMAAEFYEFEEAMSADATAEHRFSNTNTLLGKTKLEILVSKTGYLDEAKNNLAMVVRKNGRVFYVVTLGDPSRYRDFRSTELLVKKTIF
ncbi:MAG: D-alanyl-D-alanine carboxypeptidase [Candidatus Magasanikbacteria bacterium]|nr:D-alanyl-D-alanine carboxypeptidase [Candidatus Magasanikbacteria bacterium]